jgi:hypothetical protein
MSDGNGLWSDVVGFYGGAAGSRYSRYPRGYISPGGVSYDTKHLDVESKGKVSGEAQSVYSIYGHNTPDIPAM